jgi:hypothetical protein
MAFKINIMKKLFFITFLFTSLGLYSQGNLQFNRIVNLEYSQILSGTTGSAADTGETTLASLTIPENKVWKIVSASITGGDRIRGNNPLYSRNNGSSQIGVFLGGTKIITDVDYESNQVRLPIWFSSGTRNLNAYMVGTDIDPYFFSFSIIEFNIVN